MEKYDFNKIFDFIVSGGYVGAGCGIFVDSEFAQAEQKRWIEERDKFEFNEEDSAVDESLNIDFSVCPVWFLFKGEGGVSRIYDAEDLEDFCKEYDLQLLGVEKV